MSFKRASLKGVRFIPIDWVPQMPSSVLNQLTNNMVAITGPNGMRLAHRNDVTEGEAINWCHENCSKRWSYNPSTFTFFFESKVDMTLFVTTNPTITVYEDDDEPF